MVGSVYFDARSEKSLPVSSEPKGECPKNILPDSGVCFYLLTPHF